MTTRLQHILLSAAAALVGAAAAGLFSGCSSPRLVASAMPADLTEEQFRPAVLAQGPVSDTAPVVAFKMNGDYADCIPVSVDAQGHLISYPAPTDITADSQPLPLGDGWWLDRRGVGLNTVFTNYSYAQYRALAHVPSQHQLLAAVIPGSHVTAVEVLPMSRAEAAANPQAVIAYLQAVAPAFHVAAR